MLSKCLLAATLLECIVMQFIYSGGRLHRITELVTSGNPTGAIVKGFNTVGTDYKFVGTSTVAEALKDGAWCSKNR